MKKVVLLVVALFAVNVFAVDWAKVNGRPITDKDVTMALSGMNDGMRDNLLKDSNTRREILVKLIDQELLSMEAEKDKLDQTQEFKDVMATLKKQYLATAVLKKNLSDKLNDKAAKKYYDIHKNKYSTDQVHVQHILLDDESKAKDILKQVSAPNADFQALAEKHSKDPSAKNNRGDLGMVTSESPYVEEFKDAAFSGTKGEIVGPVKTTFGYHLIKIVDKKKGKILGYDEVEMRVKRDMQNDLVAQFVNTLKKGAKIQIDEKVVEKK